MRNRFGLTLCALGALFLMAAPGAAQMICDPCRVGVVFDGPWERNDEVREIVEREILALVAGDFENVRRLREFVPFRRLTFLTNEGLVEAVPELENNLIERVQGLDLEPATVRVGTSVADAIAAIPPDTEAVYVYPLIQLPPGDFERLVVALIERRLPSFSYWGDMEVELGLLASLFEAEAFDRLGRRIALNVQRILLGEDAGTLPVDFVRRIRPSLNVDTVLTLGVVPILYSLFFRVSFKGFAY